MKKTISTMLIILISIFMLFSLTGCSMWTTDDLCTVDGCAETRINELYCEKHSKLIEEEGRSQEELEQEDRERLLGKWEYDYSISETPINYEGKQIDSHKKFTCPLRTAGGTPETLKFEVGVKYTVTKTCNGKVTDDTYSWYIADSCYETGTCREYVRIVDDNTIYTFSDDYGIYVHHYFKRVEEENVEEKEEKAKTPQELLIGKWIHEGWLLYNFTENELTVGAGNEAVTYSYEWRGNDIYNLTKDKEFLYNVRFENNDTMLLNWNDGEQGTFYRVK